MHYKVSYMPSNQWKLPVNLAIGVHLFFFLGILYLPGLFEAKPKFAEIYTVSLIDIAEPLNDPQPAENLAEPPAQPAQPIAVKAVNTKKIAPISEVSEAVSPEPVKAVSLKPLKRKKKKVITKTVDTSRQKKIDRTNRQKLADLIREEELLTEKARLAQEALDAERNLLKPVKPRSSTTNSSKQNKTSTASANSGSSNLIASQYNAAIFSRLHQFWKIPEHMKQNADLTAVVVITINRDGKVANMFFENKSGDRIFDQFVQTTVEKASPMPPIPLAMRKQRYEIGLIFRPGGIQ